MGLGIDIPTILVIAGLAFTFTSLLETFSIKGVMYKLFGHTRLLCLFIGIFLFTFGIWSASVIRTNLVTTIIFVSSLIILAALLSIFGLWLSSKLNNKIFSVVFPFVGIIVLSLVTPLFGKC